MSLSAGGAFLHGKAAAGLGGFDGGGLVAVAAAACADVGAGLFFDDAPGFGSFARGGELADAGHGGLLAAVRSDGRLFCLCAKFRAGKPVQQFAQVMGQFQIEAFHLGEADE